MIRQRRGLPPLHLEILPQRYNNFLNNNIIQHNNHNQCDEKNFSQDIEQIKSDVVSKIKSLKDIAEKYKEKYLQMIYNLIDHISNNLESNDHEHYKLELFHQFLEIAIRSEQPEIVSFLIDKNDLNVNFHYEKPDSLPHISSAALTGNTKIIEILLTAGANATKIPMIKHPIYQAAIFGDMRTMIFLFDRGVNIRHIKDSDDKTHNIIYNLLLNYNVKNREEKLVYLLLHGASISLKKTSLTASEYEKFINELIKIINCELDKDINIASSLLINILSNLTKFEDKLTIVTNINLSPEQKDKIKDIIKNEQDLINNNNITSDYTPNSIDYNDIKIILQAIEPKNINEIYNARIQSLLYKTV